MKILSLEYLKESIPLRYEVVLLKETEKYLEGISIREMQDNEKKELISIILEFEKKLEPFMKKYRRFNKEKIHRMEETTNYISHIL